VKDVRKENRQIIKTNFFILLFVNRYVIEIIVVQIYKIYILCKYD